MFDEVLKDRTGINYDRGTPEDIADSRKTVEWLETPAGKRAMREVVAPALLRARALPRNDTLVVTPRRRLGLFGVREGGVETRRKVDGTLVGEV